MKNFLLLILVALSVHDAVAAPRNIHADSIINNTSHATPSLNIPSTLATASTAAVFDPTSTLASSVTTSTELSYVSGVTSPIQTPLNTKTQVLAFTAAATVGGAAAQTVAVSGLLSTDTILSVSQMTVGPGNLPLLAWSGQTTGSLTLHWVGDPGPGAVVVVGVIR